MSKYDVSLSILIHISNIVANNRNVSESDIEGCEQFFFLVLASATANILILRYCLRNVKLVSAQSEMYLKFATGQKRKNILYLKFTIG
jgi:hypothetical protein